MSIYLFTGIISAVLFFMLFALTQRYQKEAYRMSASRKADEAHLEEELMIHTALEKAGALPSHHANHHANLDNRVKSTLLNVQFWFYLIGYMVIAIELFYLYRIVKNLI